MALAVPAEVIDLYNEFHQMSHLWRWMKKLKWAGYGHNSKNMNHVEPGKLANYCPAWPQAGINLPEDWKEDPNRWVGCPSCNNIGCSICDCRFAFRHIWTDDGNYKANHVAQPLVSNEKDAWLGEGGGMMPHQMEYHTFLRMALERQTVGTFCDQWHTWHWFWCAESPLWKYIQTHH